MLGQQCELPPFWGRHRVIVVSIKVFISSPKTEPFSYRNYHDIDLFDLNRCLANLDWSAMSTIDADLESALEALGDNLRLDDELTNLPLLRRYFRGNLALHGLIVG